MQPPPSDLSPFYVLMDSLRSSGFDAQSKRLDEVLSGTWTTSSEMICELGVVVIAIRKECRTLTSAQKQLLGQCLQEVRKVWPAFGMWASARAAAEFIVGFGKKITGAPPRR